MNKKMNIEVTLVKSFTLNGRGGNPAGVVFAADSLTDDQKLRVAQAVGYPETAFVSSDDEADFGVSFFTITGEVDFCGHATLAVFAAMYQNAMLSPGHYTQRTKAGVLAVSIEPSGEVVMCQQLPQKMGAVPYRELAEVIGIDSKVIEITDLPIEIISTGLPDIIVPVPRGVLDTIEPDDKKIAALCQKYQVVGLHVFELNIPGSEFTASCRNFAPLFGISEESATGSSSGALACYLSAHLKLGGAYVFEQGRAMHCASKITVKLAANETNVTSVKVGGFARCVDIVTIALTEE